MAWSIQTGDTYTPIRSWYPGKPYDGWIDSVYELKQPIDGDFIIAAHNSGFERAIWNENLVPRHGFIKHPLRLFRCSSARAAMLGLPGSLEGLADALRLPVRKDTEGRALMRTMMSPRCVIDTPNLFGEVGPVYVDDRESLKRQAEYCEGDVAVEIEADKIMGPMTDSELEIWFLDQEINRRGIRIDRALCRRALDIVTATLKKRGLSLGELTGGVATAATQRERLIDWLQSRGVSVPSLAADDVAKLLDGELPDDVREVLEIRRDSAKSSTAKFARMLSRSESDGRMRDNLRYHGAFTGRWAGQGAQIQNYPRGSIAYMDALASAFRDAPVWVIEMMFGDVIEAAKSLLRGCLTANDGNVLLVWDYGQIEARVLPWLSGEAWKLKAFYDFDAGVGFDMYVRGYAAAFNVDPASVTKSMRQVGKVIELALGYGGGPGAFVSMAKIYRVEIADYLDELVSKFPDVAAKAQKAYAKRGVASDIPRRTWIAAEIVKVNWRAKHPKTVSFWYALEAAAIDCAKSGRPVRVNDKVSFEMSGKFLRMLLPSGRAVSYFRPSVGEGSFGPELAYWQSRDGRLMRQTTYGGKLAENVTQAVARDPMTDGMRRLRRAGFPMVGTVHDEVIAEHRKEIADARLAEGRRLLETNAPWSEGLPLVVDGFIAERYRK